MANKRKIKSEMKFEEILVRIAISFVIIVAACLAFFFGGGMNIFRTYAPKEVDFSKDFEVHYIDVGQGDSTFIRFPDGKTMLVDCGESTASSTVVNYVSEVLNFNNSSLKLDYFIFTHQDSDHVGSAKAVFDKFEVECLYRPMQLSVYETQDLQQPNINNFAVSTSVPYKNAIKAAYDEKCEMKFTQDGEKIEGENYTVEFMLPLAVNEITNNNDFSPIIKVEYNGVSFLLTGDAGTKVENAAEKKYGDKLKVDVYKAGHHGSNTSSTAKFLAKVMPKYSVVSCAKKNSFGHPGTKTVGRLKEVGSQIMSTAELGTIVFSVDDNGKAIILSHKVPDYDITIVFAVAIVLILLTWGIRIKKKGNKARRNKA